MDLISFLIILLFLVVFNPELSCVIAALFLFIVLCWKPVDVALHCGDWGHWLQETYKLGVSSFDILQLGAGNSN